jgi:DNA-directed RNA polymerase specialized sigma24 family protein
MHELVRPGADVAETFAKLRSVVHGLTKKVCRKFEITDPATIDEECQRTLVILFEGGPPGVSTDGAFRGYVARIVRNHLIDLKRVEKRRPTLGLTEEFAVIVDRDADGEDLVDEGFESLHDRHLYDGTAFERRSVVAEAKELLGRVFAAAPPPRGAPALAARKNDYDRMWRLFFSELDAVAFLVEEGDVSASDDAASIALARDVLYRRQYLLRGVLEQTIVAMEADGRLEAGEASMAQRILQGLLRRTGA